MNQASLVEASYSNEVERRLSKNFRRNRYNVKESAADQNKDVSPNTSFAKAKFLTSLEQLDNLLPSDAMDFFKTGFRVASPKIPKAAKLIYRRGLWMVARTIKQDPSNSAAWKLLLLYDGLVLAPYEKPETFTSSIIRRATDFMAGDWTSLLSDALKFRNPVAPSNCSPISGDPLDSQAQRAQFQLLKNHSISGASKCLRAPINPPPIAPGKLTATFRKLNPQIGDQVPDPPFQTSLPTVPLPPRRPHPRPEIETDLPEPMQLKPDLVIRHVRRSNAASAGGLSGTTYKHLRTWFENNDQISDDLAHVFNLILANKVPLSISKLLNAGRGVAVPKNEKGDLRPIVIGHAIMRILGSIALRELSEDVIAFFLKPAAVQFGVGIPGGCELMVSAIKLYLEANPNHIDISCDAKNAFNTWDRKKMWSVLQRHFPSIYSFVKLMYGDSSEILFHEPGIGLSSILNSIGSRQGCSLGSFLYCLSIHTYLLTLRSEYPDLLILAYCDDVHILGEPELAIKASISPMGTTVQF